MSGVFFNNDVFVRAVMAMVAHSASKATGTLTAERARTRDGIMALAMLTVSAEERSALSKISDMFDDILSNMDIQYMPTPEGQFRCVECKQLQFKHADEVPECDDPECGIAAAEAAGQCIVCFIKQQRREELQRAEAAAATQQEAAKRAKYN